MRGQFRVQRTLQNRLGQLLQKTVLPGYLFHRRTPLQQLIHQLPIQSHSISSQLVEKIVYTIWFTPSLPPQQTSSRPKAAHFAATVERSLYSAFVVACSCPWSLPMHLSHPENPSKNACQVPKPPNSMQTNQIELAQ